MPSRVYARWKWTVRAGLLVVPLVVFLWGAVIVYFTPERYESKVMFEYLGKRPQAEVLKLLKSGEVVKWAVGELNLTKEWSIDRENAERITEGITRTRVEPNTGLIEISVKHLKKETARDLANTLVKSLGRYEQSLMDVAAQAKIEASAELLVEAEDEMVAKRQALSRLISVRGEKAADPLSQLDLDAARRDWDHAHQQVLDLRSKIVEMKRESANPVKWTVVHTEPLIAYTPGRKNFTLEDATMQALVAGVVVTFVLPYFLELVLPRRRRSAIEKDKWPDAFDEAVELPGIPVNG